MSPRKRKNISYFNVDTMSIISVAMVLLLLGIVVTIGVFANETTKKIRENIGFDVSVCEAATAQQIAQLRQDLTRGAYAASVKYISKEDAMRQWRDETGEDIEKVLGFNPLTAQFEVHVKSQYMSLDSLNRIADTLQKNELIDEVKVYSDQVKAVNSSLKQTVTILLVVAIAMIIISLALINNTVRMTVYSRRFLIYTMKLVGATPSFIRRPIVVSNMLNGMISAVVATILLGGILYYLSFDGLVGAMIQEFIPVWLVLAIFGILLVTGAVLCSITAFFAADRYIRLDYDKLF